MRCSLLFAAVAVAQFAYGQAPKELRPLLEVVGADTNARLGEFVLGIGDVNRDGFADVAVSEPGYIDEPRPYKTFIYYGGRIMSKSPGLIFEGGGTIASGDFNHDGWIDLAIEKYSHDTVFIYYGGPTMDTIPDLILHGPRGHVDYYGRTLAAGDVDGDGTDDLIVVETDVSPSDSSFARGAIYVYAGGAELDTIPRATILGDTVKVQLGYDVALGDINKDGRKDVLALGYNTTSPVSQDWFFYLSIFLGDSLFRLDRDYCIEARKVPGGFKEHVSSFDSDSGGVDDILLSKIYIFNGGAELDSLPSYYVSPPYDDTVTYGPYPWVSGGGDYNHDGVKDIVLRSDYHQFGAAPGFFVMLGKKNSPGHFQAYRVFAQCCGFAIYGDPENAGDVNGDGIDDIIIGDPTEAYPTHKGFFGIYSGDSSLVVSVNESVLQPPEKFQLDQNYPNPFNPRTTIEYSIPQRQIVKMKIFNSLGEEVVSLVNQVQEMGKHTIQWDGRDNDGRRVASGVYYYQLETPDHQETKKLINLK